MSVDIARSIRMARAHANILSLDALVRETGLSRGYLWKLSCGRAKNPGILALSAIARAAGVPVSRLLAWGEDP